MKDWIFPSCVFLVFIYGMVSVGLYINQYTNSDISVYSSSDADYGTQGDIGGFLKEISKSFK